MMAQAQHRPSVGAATGALVDQRELIRLRFAAERINLSSRRRRYGLLMGGHHSPFRGRGLEFQKLREYQGGDEIRHIDWRVTARTAQPHTKVFQEERERPVMVCLDQRRSLFFGTQCCFKSVLAAHVASLLAWAALHNNDRVGGLVFSDDDHREIRPRRGRRSVLHFIHRAVLYNHRLAERAQEAAAASSATDSLARGLEELRRLTRPGSTVFVVSDFAGIGEDAARHLHHIARHNDIVAITVADPMEERLPLSGQQLLSDGSDFLHVEVNRDLRRRYLRQRSALEEERQALFHRAGIHEIRIRTDDDYFTCLQSGLNL